jgi:hypothetical protein
MTMTLGLDRTLVRVILVAAMAIGVSGCGGLKDTFGLGKAPPDEYRVVEQAPLALPDSYQLLPPVPGAPRPQVEDTADQAEDILLGSASGAASARGVGNSPGEEVFLSIAGANEAEPGIRQIVNRESGALAEGDDGFVDDLIFWDDDAPEGIALDPVGEAQRLRTNQANGLPVTHGETPIIVPEEKAPLEDLNIF